jgi:energy-coupling factor transporter ATP-binding protein EcfA2
MFEEYQICPYTGLRSFTEEESLYFKGREEHIEQATEQLQRNKFLMLTGASGDGKSSLVYAGIVPNARAGFLKSKYTQWNVADFRPERTPFKNLCRAIAKQLDIGNPQTVESELQHGFSALVDLYRNSKCFVDVDSVAWQQADDTQRAALKRSAANLIIIVDQFEEFFTNPENYHHGVPSRDSNLVLNVLLETARIALEENLPIYIVFTMRSDYIGQCAAFRSLPEYIGFSQFFVPRLNRSQLQQVIEEPATLSGNQISRRLTERLIHDISEGVDQLPILQHALNQIWHAANSGKEEMDLIHYAMVGGMPSGELPEDQVDRFVKWFANLPEKIKECYQEPNLQNVLDTHANKLYESAAESYRNKTGKSLSDEVAKEIIKTTFTCLTKIDQSRAVRNRMTLKEIYNILNREDVEVDTVGWVLNIFRESGNTFIRPFITDDPESGKLGEETVLDITHESLIRNWELLEQWAKEEFDNYSISLDFEKQLNRWVESNKSSGFLLSIGPLAYFESWYNKVNPNTSWIARYLPEDIELNKKLEKAEVVLSNTQDFLKKSARKHIVTRTIVRYGPRRMVAALAVIALFVFSSFALRNYLQQQNAHVLKTIKEQSLQLTNRPKTNSIARSNLLAELLRSGSTTVDEIVRSTKDSITRINVINRLAGMLILQGRKEPEPLIRENLATVDKLFREYPLDKTINTEKLTLLLKEINYLRINLELAYLYNPTAQIDSFRIRNAERSASVFNHIVKLQPEGFKDVNQLNIALENALNHQVLSKAELQNIVNELSPFENSNRSVWAKDVYARDKLSIRGFSDYGFKFNGLYQQLAYLYAAQGNSTSVLQCVDSLLKYNQSYYQNDYTAMIDNVSNIVIVFYVYDQTELVDPFIKGYCQRKKISETEVYQRLIGRLNTGGPGIGNLFETYTNLNTEYGSEEMIQYLFAQYRKSISETVSDHNELNFLLALSWKDEGILRLTKMTLRNQVEGRDSLFVLFDKALAYYRKTDKEYLEQQISAAKLTDNDAISVPRKFLFLYPDYRTPFNPIEPRQFYYYYNSDCFVGYVLKNKLFDELYEKSDLPFISSWLEAYFANMTDPSGSVRMRADTAVLIELETVLAQRSLKLVHTNFLYWHLAYESYQAGHMNRALQFYDKVEIDKIPNLLRYPEAGANREVFYTIATSVTGLTGLNRFADAYAIIKVFKNPINRSSLYAFAAKELLRTNVNATMAQQLIDSAKIELTRIENLSTGQPNRILLAYALSMQDPQKNSPEAYTSIKNIGNKFWPTLRISRAFAFHGDLYHAQQNIPENISDSDQAEFLWNILYGYADGSGTQKNDWKEFTSNYPWVNTRVIIYINEDN